MDAESILIVAKPITEWLGVSVRKVFYSGEAGRLPIFKIGNQWAGRKSSIARHFEKLESEKTAAA